MDILKSIQDEISKQKIVFEKRLSSLEDDKLTFFKSVKQNLENCSSIGIFYKSFSSDLADKFPEGGWRTVNGARVFLNNGKVIAGLNGFNGAIDSFFKEKNDSVDSKKENTQQESIKEESKNNDNPSNESKQRFSNVKEIDRKQITTAPELFQGRQHAFSEESVNKIVSEGFDKTNDPIVVWFDKDKDKYIVISGHSRFEASKRLFADGDKSLSTMPVKEFLGDQQEAVNYAVLESNRASTQEGMISDVKAVSKMLKEGYNKTEMLKYIKPKSYLESVINYAQLNPNGKFLDYLSQSSSKSFPYLERNASWVGEIRKQLGDKFTNAHESEVFDYMYNSGGVKGLKQTKEQFYNLINNKVSKIDFNPSKPLNLNNVVSTSAVTNSAKTKIKELSDDIVYFKSEIDKKQDLIVRAMAEGKLDLVNKFEQVINDSAKKIVMLKHDIYKLENDSKKIESETTHDLFS